MIRGWVPPYSPRMAKKGTITLHWRGWGRCHDKRLASQTEKEKKRLILRPLAWKQAKERRNECRNPYLDQHWQSLSLRICFYLDESARVRIQVRGEFHGLLFLCTRILSQEIPLACTLLSVYFCWAFRRTTSIWGDKREICTKKCGTKSSVRMMIAVWL